MHYDKVLGREVERSENTVLKVTDTREKTMESRFATKLAKMNLKMVGIGN